MLVWLTNSGQGCMNAWNQGKNQEKKEYLGRKKHGRKKTHTHTHTPPPTHTHTPTHIRRVLSPYPAADRQG